MPRPTRSRTVAARVLDDDQASLLDVVDNALTKGVVLRGDLTLALAHVDLVYVQLAMLLCAADRVLPAEVKGASGRRHLRRGLRGPR
jgi:gas vesicle structural protein